MTSLGSFYTDVLTLSQKGNYERLWAVRMIRIIGRMATHEGYDNSKWWEDCLTKLNFGQYAFRYDYEQHTIEDAENFACVFPSLLKQLKEEWFEMPPELEESLPLMAEKFSITEKLTALIAENFYTKGEPFSDLLNAALSKNPTDKCCERIVQWIKLGTTPVNFQNCSHFYIKKNLEDPDWDSQCNKRPIEGPKYLYSGRCRISPKDVDTLSKCCTGQGRFTLTSVLSTSTSRSKAKKNNVKCFIIIKFENKWWDLQNGILIEDCTCDCGAVKDFAWEGEVIIFPGSIFKVISKEQSEDYPIFTLEPVSKDVLGVHMPEVHMPEVHMGGRVSQSVCRLCGLLAVHH